MITVTDNAPLDAMNTFGLSCRCRRLVTFTDSGDLPGVADALGGETPVILGGGSNVLLPQRLDRTVLHCADASLTPGYLAGAGAALDEVVRSSCLDGHAELAPLSGIPGTIGGAVVQNAGAYGAETGQCVRNVQVYDLVKRQKLIFDNMDCGFGYRTSVFKHMPQGRYVIYRVQLAFTAETPMQTRRRVLDTRAAKLPDPSSVGSAGSYFKNPCVSPEQFNALAAAHPEMPHWPMADGTVKLSAAWLIDQAGWKGRSLGNVQAWPTQPLVLANATGEATAAEVMALEREIAASVLEKFSVSLQPEVIKIPKN